MMKSIKTMACLIFLAISMNLFSGTPQIYRCEIDDVVIFADAPCNDEAVEHVPRLGISVVEPAADLEEVAKRNREFIQRREERRQFAVQSARQRASAGQQHVPATLPPQARVPYWIGTMPHERESADVRDLQPLQIPGEEDDRFSALRGPFPGTRRPNRQN